MTAEGEVQERQDEENREQEEANLAAEMERMMTLQEENQHDGDESNGANENNDEPLLPQNDDIGIGHARPLMIPTARSYLKIYYTPLSFAIAILHILYILRTRKQVYLALLYLTTSKISYIVLGNAILAFFLCAFNFVIRKFLNGLRFIESETIADKTRWNVTETCLALTMFRQELSVGMVGMFLVCILSKSLHLAVDLRGSHLRMTEEVFYYLDDGDQNMGDPSYVKEIWWVWRAIGIFIPKKVKAYFLTAYMKAPRIRSSHLKFYLLVNLLHLSDLLALTYCATQLLESGPSAHILFGFEAAILLASIVSIQALYGIHVFDGVITLIQRAVLDRPDEDDNIEINSDEQNAIEGMTGDVDGQLPPQNQQKRDSFLVMKFKGAVQRITFFWRDHRATATFAVELMAVAATFLFSLILFVVVFTIYGLPINIVRDLYVAYSKLRSRLSAFASYRRLTSNMNTRFKSITTEEELERAGRTCIICRESMDIHGVNGDCKILPICGHGFHKHCLREWLTQQQTCPTCRADIQKNEDRARAEEKRQAQEEENNATERSNIQTGVTVQGTDIVQVSSTEPVIKTDTNVGPVGNTSKDIAFPSIYKIKSLRGASVWIFSNDNTGEECKQYTHKKLLRVIDNGKFVVCTGKKWQAWDKCDVNELMKSAGEGSFLKIPDGWILEQDVGRLLVLSPSTETLDAVS